MPETARKMFGIWRMDILPPDDAANAWNEGARKKASHRAPETPEAAAGQCGESRAAHCFSKAHALRARQAISKMKRMESIHGARDMPVFRSGIAPLTPLPSDRCHRHFRACAGADFRESLKFVRPSRAGGGERPWYLRARLERPK